MITNVNNTTCIFFMAKYLTHKTKQTFRTISHFYNALFEKVIVLPLPNYTFKANL